MPPITPPSQKKEWVSERTLQKWVLASQAFAAVAVPVVLGIAGFFVQKAVQGETIKRDYVSLAITLLAPQKKDDPQTSTELKQWAIRLLNESSPVKLTAREIDSIDKQGLPRFSFGTDNTSNPDPEMIRKITEEALQRAMQEAIQKKPPKEDTK